MGRSGYNITLTGLSDTWRLSLEGHNESQVRVLIGNVLPEAQHAKRTTLNWHKRLREALRKRLEAKGWTDSKTKPWIFTRDAAISPVGARWTEMLLIPIVDCLAGRRRTVYSIVCDPPDLFAQVRINSLPKCHLLALNFGCAL